MNALYFNVSDNESELEDIRNGLKIWDKYIQGLKTELLILVPTASEKSTYLKASWMKVKGLSVRHSRSITMTRI